jgi:trimethylamine--corrinoid protein Co-methyltransferase
MPAAGIGKSAFDERYAKREFNMKLQALEVLSREEIQKIHESSLDVLMKVGVTIRSDAALKLLEQGGAAVDYQKNLAKIPNHLLEEVVKWAPSNIVLFDRDRKGSLNHGGNNSYVWSGNHGTYVLTSGSGKRRIATLDDVAKFARLADALENVHVVGIQTIPQDVPREYADLKSAEVMFNNTSKHVFFNQSESAVAAATLDLAQAVLGDEELEKYPIMTSLVDPTTPLAWGKDAVEILIDSSRRGVPCIVASCPTTGGTAPITMAGTLVVQNAEILSGILINQLARRGAPVIYGTASMILDMREGMAALSTPEAVALRIAITQLGRFYNIPIEAIGPDSDSHCLDEQNAWEKIMTAAAAIFSRANIVMNAGMFASGYTVSYEQLTIDNEILGWLLHLCKGIEVTSDTLALGQIERVGPAGHFLGVDSRFALKRLETEYWLPKISCRASYAKWLRKGAKDAVERAREETDMILRTHKPVALDYKTRKDLARIVKDFTRSGQGTKAKK